MGAIIALNVVVIIVFGLAGGLVLARRENTFEATVAGLMLGALALGLSILGWIIYIVGHFLAKVW